MPRTRRTAFDPFKGAKPHALSQTRLHTKIQFKHKHANTCSTHIYVYVSAGRKTVILTHVHTYARVSWKEGCRWQQRLHLSAYAISPVLISTSQSRFMPVYAMHLMCVCTKRLVCMYKRRLCLCILRKAAYLEVVLQVHTYAYVCMCTHMPVYVHTVYNMFRHVQAHHVRIHVTVF